MNNLRLLRTKRKLTKIEISNNTGISKEILGRMELNEIVPSKEEQEKLAKFFQVPVEKIFS